MGERVTSEWATEVVRLGGIDKLPGINLVSPVDVCQDLLDARAERDKLREEAERLRDVLNERNKQDAKWGVQNHTPMKWLAILTEEVGEVAKAIIEGNHGDYRKELVQVAAVAVASIESLDRNLFGLEEPG